MSGLLRDEDNAGHLIRWHRPDAIGVGDEELRRSFAVHGGGLLRDWPVADLATITTNDLDLLLAAQPDVVLIGTGERQQQLPPAVLYHGLAKGIGIEVMANAAAARTYNLLIGEQRNVLAAFILPG